VRSWQQKKSKELIDRVKPALSKAINAKECFEKQTDTL